MKVDIFISKLFAVSTSNAQVNNTIFSEVGMKL